VTSQIRAHSGINEATPQAALVYDPTTGEMRSSSTDDIACWFIDSDDNEESFFVRHAYFTGGSVPAR